MLRQRTRLPCQPSIFAPQAVAVIAPAGALWRREPQDGTTPVGKLRKSAIAGPLSSIHKAVTLRSSCAARSRAAWSPKASAVCSGCERELLGCASNVGPIHALLLRGTHERNGNSSRTQRARPASRLPCHASAERYALRAALARRHDGAELCRGEPRQVAPRPHHLVLRQLFQRCLCPAGQEAARVLLTPVVRSGPGIPCARRGGYRSPGGAAHACR